MRSSGALGSCGLRSPCRFDSYFLAFHPLCKLFQTPQERALFPPWPPGQALPSGAVFVPSAVNTGAPETSLFTGRFHRQVLPLES